MGQKILILGENDAERRLCRDILESSPFSYQCFESDSLQQAQEMIKNRLINTILVDHRIIGSQSFEKLTPLKKVRSGIRLLILVDQIESKDVEKAHCYGVDQFCQKHDAFVDLINAIEGVIP